ncbi:Alpha/beta hydrolase fold-1 [Aspergillus ambiguus]|uniref:alpha/beta hydrolase n=1 Tax=Aspergillus ambiguus TaxID=176160 RepID=UPI003CCCBC4E
MELQKPVIVIIPGAYHRPIHYRKVADPLRAQGYKVLSFDLAVCGEEVNPELSFFDDAAIIREHLLPLLDQGKKAVIVSHSYGSLPVTALVDGLTIAERTEKGLEGGIAAVISIAGFVFPARGKSIFGNKQNPPTPPYQIRMDGTAHLQDTAKSIFFSDLSPEDADHAWAHLHKKQTTKSFDTWPQCVESEYRCPKTYILCENDTTVPPPFQEQMAGLGGFDIVRVKSGHAPFLTVPEEVVAIIIRVTGSVN